MTVLQCALHYTRLHYTTVDLQHYLTPLYNHYIKHYCLGTAF